MLRLRVLGELAIDLDGREVESPASRRARSLLGLLAVERRAHPRSQLAARFWPDVLDESARTSLRSALSSLRRSLGPDADSYLRSDRATVSLAGDDLVWTDLAEFERLLSEGRAEDALGLCRGDLLDGVEDDWVYERREEHRDRVGAALAGLAAEAEEGGDLEAAVALTRRQAALDPLAEDAQRELIRRLAQAGDRSGAVAAYQRLQERFRRELGIAPSARTRELVDSVRAPEEEPAAHPALLPAEHATGTVTLLFTDQVSSTETLQRLGDDQAERLRRAHFRLLRGVAGSHRGHEVKNLGDGLMVAFTSAVDAVACAIGMQQAVHGQAALEDGDRLEVRVGLGVGEPIRDEDDYFGTPVVVAKRLCDKAEAGQILATDLVPALVGSRGGFSFRPLGPVQLKGIAEPLPCSEVLWAPSTEQRIPLPPTLVSAQRGRFVGRSEALAQLERSWAAASGGRSSLVLLAGEPGIGKTRLSAELCLRVHADGAVVLTGHCYEGLSAPYQPFAEALRHYVASCPPAEASVQLAPRRRELAALVPELATGDGSPRSENMPDEERFRLFEAVASLVRDVSALRPMVLLLDDLHWADPGSLLMLRHLARATEGARLLVIGTYRALEVGEDHPLASARAELRRSGAVEELQLDGLDEDEVAELVADRSGDVVAERLARRVADRTEGNPFFVEELLRHLAALDELPESEPGVPASVQDVLLRRLRRLDEDSRRTLGIAAVAGREFDFALLARITGTDAEGLLDQLEAACAADVLLELPATPGRYGWAHALIHETVYGQVSATRRALLHRRVGEALEAMEPDEPERRTGELARHFHAAGDLEKAFRYHSQAAVAAERAVALEIALGHVDGALAAGEMLGLEPATERSMRELLRSRAWLHQGLGDADAADAHYATALDAARAAGDRSLELHILNGLGMLWHVRDFQRSLAAHEDALAIAEEIGDADGQVSALNRLSLVHANQLDFARAVSLGERALDIAKRMGDDRATARAMDCLKFCALQLGQVEQLEKLTAWLERFYRASGEVWYLHWTLLESAYAPLTRGQWDDAAARAEEALSLARTEHETSVPLILDTLSWIHRCEGDYGAALEASREAVKVAGRLDRPVWVGWVAVGLASPLLDLLAVDEAIATLEDGLAWADGAGARGQIYRCLGLLVEAHLDRGDVDVAGTFAHRAEALGREITVPPGAAYIWGDWTHSAIASVAQARGDHDRAAGLLRSLAHAAEREGVLFSLARQARLLAGCLEASGDADGALRELDRSLAAAGQGVPAERWQAHAARARLLAERGDAAGAAADAEVARGCVAAMAASVGDDRLAEAFSRQALARIAPT